MIPIDKQWESLKNEYIHKVEKALSSVKHPRRKEVLEDVRLHLDRRFSELEPKDKTWENLQAIITEMGPASDYVEFLEPHTVISTQKSHKKYFLITAFASVAIIAVIILSAQTKSTIVNTVVSGQGRLEDKIDYPFVNDPEVLGAWKSVDFVKTIAEFKPNQKNFKGELWLNHLIFEKGGFVRGKVFIWTKGLVISEKVRTASAYQIKEIDGERYMFFEWKSGDYTIRHQKPSYYVLKNVSIESVQTEAMFGQTADIPSTSFIDENGHIVDKVDYPFVNDPEAIGAWESVDFVKEIEDFNPEKTIEDDLYLTELYILEDGKTNFMYSWTKGLLLTDDTASKYIIKEIDGSTYMFFEWKSGDYTIRRSKPSYYVLKKISGKAYVQSRTIDNIDYPFVDDPDVIGTWKSVDFVETPDEFIPGTMQWPTEELFLKELVFLPDGKIEDSQDTWTKGLVLDSRNQTASRYIFEEIDGTTYMFIEEKNGDYTIRGMEPSYYVLKKE